MKKIKKEIIKMLIPIVGTWFVLDRVLPTHGNITWWDISKNAIFVIIALTLYQMICWIGFKVFYMMYFFDYTFNEVFTKW